MRAVILVLAAAACYAPHAVEGVACDPNEPACPSGQACVPTADGYRCERGPGIEPDAAIDAEVHPDAAPDAPMIDPQGDEDGDGRKNLDDNCVFIANADQHDEDDDQIGDACDPCPIFAVGGATDGDGDGVGDACDPRPFTAGDRIYLFESFKTGIPMTAGWDSYGMWGGNDQVQVNLADGAHANISFAMPTIGSETITTQVVIQGLGATGSIRGAGTIDMKGDAGSDGIACDLFASAGDERRFGVQHATASAAGADDLSSQVVAWNQGQRYVITERRRNTEYTCATGTTNLTAQSALTNDAPQVGLWASNTGAKFDYLFVVTSP